MSRLRSALVAVCIVLSVFGSAAVAAPFPTLSMDVGVCDPNAPQNCIKPDSSGNVPITGTISASLGGFTPSASGARGTPLSVTTSDSSGNLPTGNVVIVSNVGTTNPMYCNVNGVAATTSDQLITANGGWFAFTIPAAVTTLHCIATGGSTTANSLGGAGLATGTGGGSGGGGGGGGAITAALGSYAAGALSAGAFAAGSGVDGWDLTQGTKADAAWTTGSGSVIALLKAIATAEIVTNRAVNVAQINGVTPLMGNGVTGTGSPRVTVASDNTPFSVNPLSATAPVSTMNSASTNSGLNSAVAGVFDDVSPTSITENSFGFLRMSANRNLYGTIRDAAGNERGVNVNASNQLAVAGPVTVVSGGIASGAIASGAVASGAYSSGAYAAGALAAGAFASGAGVDGWDLTQGAKADSACGTATGTCSVVALLKYLNTAATSPLPAQTGIGNVNIGAVQSAGSNYETVAASQTAQALGATGATGDYLSHCVIYPASTSPGVVTVFDNTNAAGTNVIAFAGGGTSTSNLTPISVPVGAISAAGAWKVTTGANVSVTCYGKFT